MNVQRGTTTLSSASTTVTLGTPVTVGKSFVVASIRTQTNRPDSSLPLIYLDTVSGGNYTQLTFSRSRTSSGENVVIDWQVVTGNDFNVQQGSAEIASGTDSATATISSITTSRAFPIIYYNPSNAADGPSNTAVNVSINSATQLGFLRGRTTNSVMSIRWQIIEWVGATVGTYTRALTGSSATLSITAVDLAKSFIVSYFDTSASLYGNRVLPRIRFNSSSQLGYSRGSSTDSVDIRSFVVSHNDIVAQQGTSTITGTDLSTTATITSSDTANTCLFTSVQGNGQVTTSSSDGGRVTHTLTNSTTATFERGGTSGDSTLDYFVVTVTPKSKNTGNFLAFM